MSAPTKIMPQPGGQTLFLSSTSVMEVLFEGERGPGKCLKNNEFFLTRDEGWKPIGDAKVGDYAASPDGAWTEVTNVYPNKNVKLYDIEFYGGHKVTACVDHSWTVGHAKNFYRDGWRTKTTRDLLDNPTNWFVPWVRQAAPGEQWEGEDPYMAGLLLGDGCLSKGAHHITLYSIDDEILAYAASLGWTTKPVGFYQTDSPHASLGQTAGRAYVVGTEIKERWWSLLGRHKAGEKFVPECLKLADPETRLAVLQGLMDSDGSIETNGKCRFVSKSEQLARDVGYLVDSLGGKSNVYKEHRPSPLGGVDWRWRVNLSHLNQFNPFRLKRKADRVTEVRHKHGRYIKSITPAGRGDATCITVDHPSHEFIADNFIVTHNSWAMLHAFAMHTGKGYGSHWRGVIFRKESGDLTDMIKKSYREFKQAYPEATYNKTEKTWTWPDGESLTFAHFKDENDYWSWHGQEIPFIGWEELTVWPNDKGYTAMFSCCRSAGPKEMPRVVRATTNPYGCVPYGDVLTETRGWVPIQDVEEGELVASSDAHGDLTYRKVAKTISFPNWQGKMVKQDGRGLTMEFTSDHFLPLLNTDRTQHSMREFQHLPAQAHIRGTALWNPESFPDGKVDSLEEFAKFLDWDGRTEPISADNVEIEDQTRPVYCLEVEETESFFIRQNGCVWLSGNSGKNWVRKRFQLPQMRYKIWKDKDENGDDQPSRLAIPGFLHENKILMELDPNYIQNVKASAGGNEEKLKAWLLGDWDAISGGMFDDVWTPRVHVVDPFPIPKSWKITHAYDWGGAKPGSYGLWAESSGEPVEIAENVWMGAIRGDRFRIGEWYVAAPGKSNVGLSLTPKDQALGMIECQKKHGVYGYVQPGPADHNIFDKSSGQCTYDTLRQHGLRFRPADKGPFSRVKGWEVMRQFMQDAIPDEEFGGRDRPGLYIFSNCTYFIDLVPTLVRDPKNPDDIDTDAEDHIADEARYYLRQPKKGARRSRG